MGNTNAKRVSLDNRDIVDNDYKAKDLQEAMEEIDFRRETKEPTGFLDISEVRVFYNSATNQVQIIPTGTEWTYYIAGEIFTITGTLSVSVPTTDGYHIFYLEKDGVFSTSSNPSLPDYNTFYFRIAFANYSTDEARVNYFADISSTISMPWGTSQRINETYGVGYGPQSFIIENFITAGDGSQDAHCQFGLTNGKIFHNDLFYDVISDPTPTNDFEQDLNPIAKIPIYYKSGPNGIYRKSDATSFPIIENIGNRAYYNEWTGATWQLTECDENTFFTVYYYATTNPMEPIIGFLGSINSTSPANAISQDTSTRALDGFPLCSVGFIKAIVWNTSDAFTNTPKTRFTGISEGVETINIDRYVQKAEYNGNANSNRWLELSNAESSDNQPLLIPEDSYIRTVTLQATASIGNAKSIGFYKLPNLSTPVFTVVVPFSGSEEHQWEVTQFFNKGDKVAVRVVNGSIQKPVVRFWIETAP